MTYQKRRLLLKALAVFCALLMPCTLFTACAPKPPTDDGGEIEKPEDDGSSDGEVIDPDKIPPIAPDLGQDAPYVPEDLPAPTMPTDSDYSYSPHIDGEMPRVSIKTPNGSNDWATVYFPSFDNTNPDNNIDWQYNDCTVTVDGCADDYKLTDIEAQVKVRGNWTTTYDKKPFRIKFSKKQKMLGLNGDAKCKSWVLLANYKDVSLLRNNVALYLGQQFLSSDGYYCSDFRDVELYLNGQYWGVYLLVEQQQVNENRIDINEPEEDYTGTDIGYFLEFDGYHVLEAENEHFTIDYGSQNGYSIKSDVYCAAQKNFIRNYLNNVYKICDSALKGTYYAFNDTYTGLVRADTDNVYDTVSKVIDIPSLVDTYILNEIVCDYDLGWSSFLMDVDMSASGDKILRFEAPWDFDSALGLRDACESGMGMFASSNNPWLSLFQNQKWFQSNVRAKWKSASENDVQQNTLKLIDDLQTAYGTNYYSKNFTKWSWNSVYERVNGEFCWQARQVSSQADAAQYLKSWLNTRFNYLDSVWDESVRDEDDGPEEGAVGYRFEAEKCAVTGGVAVKSGNGASGSGYLGNVSGGAGKTITITFNSAKDAQAYICIGLSRRFSEAQLNNWFSLKVNGADVDIPQRRIPATTTNDEWHDWARIRMASVQLKKGANTVVITTASGDTTNVDYFDIFCTSTLYY